MTATPKQVADVQEVLGCVRESWPEGSSDAWCSEHWVEDGTPQGKSVEWTDRGCPVAVAAADAATNDHGQPPRATHSPAHDQDAPADARDDLTRAAWRIDKIANLTRECLDRESTEQDARSRLRLAEARVTELEATLTRVRALADAFADDGIARYGGNIAWHIEEAIANEKGDFPDAADQRIASQRDRADAAEATLAKVAALADEWDGYGHGLYNIHPARSLPCSVCDLLAKVRAALASAGRPATMDGEDTNGEACESGFHPDRWCGGCDPYCGGCPAIRPSSPVVAPSATDEDGGDR